MANYICHTLEYVFQTTYEESRLNAVDVGDKDKWLKEGMDCNLLFWNGKVSVSSNFWIQPDHFPTGFGAHCQMNLLVLD